MNFFNKKKTQDEYQNVTVSIEELLQEGQNAKNLNLNLKKAQSLYMGGKNSVLRGRGMEYSESRPYVYQDEIRHIDWKVTARLSNTFTKIFIEEKERPTYVIVDQRSNMFFGSQNCFKSVLAAKIASNIAFATLNGADKLGGFILTDDEQLEFKPSSHKKSLAHFLGSLSKASFNALEINQNEQLSLNAWTAVFQRILLKTHPGCLIFIISDFLDFPLDLKKVLFTLRKKADIYALNITDPLEKKLPAIGAVGFSFGDKEVSFDSSDKSLQKKYQEYYLEKQKQLGELFKSLGIICAEFSTKDEYRQKLRKVLCR